MKKNAQPKAFYNVVSNGTEDKVGEMRIYGYIPDVDWDEYKMKNTIDSFVKDFKALEKNCDIINLRIHSGGGDLYHGFPMINLIYSSSKEVHTYNDGITYSLGALLLAAGKVSHAPKTSMVMVHSGLTGIYGNAVALREKAEELDKYNHVMSEILAAKTGKTPDEIKALYFDGKDHLLTGEEAHAAGIIDVLEEYDVEVPENISNMSHGEVMNYFKAMDSGDVEESFIDKIVNRLRPLVSNFLPTNTQIQEEPPMKLEVLAAAVVAAGDKGLNLSPEQVAVIKNELDTYNGAGEKFTKTELDAAVENVKKELDAAVENAKKEKDTEIQNLTKERNEFEAKAKELGSQDGGKVTGVAGGNDKFSNDGEDDIQAILDSLPHNKAIANNPMYNRSKSK